MNYTINIAREVIGATGHKTIEFVQKGLHRTAETEAMIAGMDVIRRYDDPFNASTEIVVIR